MKAKALLILSYLLQFDKKMEAVLALEDCIKKRNLFKAH